MQLNALLRITVVLDRMFTELGEDGYILLERTRIIALLLVNL
jgi:hypothetical protein